MSEIPKAVREFVSQRDTLCDSATVPHMDCLVEGCGKPSDRRGMCHMHYKRFLREGTPGEAAMRNPLGAPPEERFWAKVEKTEECWLWVGGQQHGYGCFWTGDQVVRSHVWSYEQAHGPVPDGKVVDHRCRVPLCVNPDHLRAATRSENGQNTASVRTTRTGVRGVTFHKGSGKFHARYGLEGRMNFVGAFDTAEEAEVAVRSARSIAHPFDEGWK